MVTTCLVCSRLLLLGHKAAPRLTRPHLLPPRTPFNTRTHRALCHASITTRCTTSNSVDTRHNGSLLITAAEGGDESYHTSANHATEARTEETETNADDGALFDRTQPFARLGRRDVSREQLLCVDGVWINAGNLDARAARARWFNARYDPREEENMLRRCVAAWDEASTRRPQDGRREQARESAGVARRRWRGLCCD